MNFKSLSSAEFVLGRKEFLAQYPKNYIDSDKFRLESEHFDLLRDYLLTKLAVIPVDKQRKNRFTVLGGAFTIDNTPNVFYIRMIIENDSRLAMYQLTFHEEYKKYARRLITMLSLISS